jgi:hypothetical protein
MSDIPCPARSPMGSSPRAHRRPGRGWQSTRTADRPFQTKTEFGGAAGRLTPKSIEQAEDRGNKMKSPPIFGIFLGLAVATAPFGLAEATASDLRSLQGTRATEAAYEVSADGTRATNFGEHPKGVFIVDSKGRYSLQIFRESRVPFASGDKTKGTAEDYRQAVLGSSTHFGKVSIDRAKHQLDFDLEAGSFPNWDGKRQVRDYSFKDGVLSYAVPASAYGGGVVAYSVWRRVGR